MGRPRMLSAGGGIDPIAEEPHPPRAAATYPDPAALACAISAEASAVLAVMRRSLRHPRAAADDAAADHPLVASLKSLRRLAFSPSPSPPLPSAALRPFLDAVRSEEANAAVTSASLAALHGVMALTGRALPGAALREVVDAVAGCRFEAGAEPHAEEAVLMRMLQALLACLRAPAAPALGDQHVCTAVNTCFRVVHQAAAKGELLQRFSRHAMHELVRLVFARLPLIGGADDDADDGTVKPEMSGMDKNHPFGIGQMENGNGSYASEAGIPDENSADESGLSVEPYGIPCMVEIFHFLCSLLNVAEQIGFDEDLPLFALKLINSAIELGGSAIAKHPKLLSLVQDELFRNLMQFGLSISPLILSMVCSIVLNLYHHLRSELKMQLEAFFCCIILRLSQPRFGATYHQQEVAMEALVDFCRLKNFMVEMYANLDCDITCRNVFEELANLLSKSAFPINCPLSSMHILALEGLIAVIQGMADRIGNATSRPELRPVELDEYAPFWTVKCENFSDPQHWVKFVRQRKYVKRRLMIGADHFNRDPKKGLEFLQGNHLLPEKLDPQSVACFFRFTAGLDKNLVGDFLGNHDEFCVQVLHEFAQTFDFEDMNLDTALRLFLETFRLPGESQKIQRVLEAFSDRYYEQAPQAFANKDTALLLSYSIIMLNTDQHNMQVKKKMTEEDFIKNNRNINGGNDLPREMLSELYHAICRNEIKTTPEQGMGYSEMSPSRWIDLMRKSKSTPPYIVSDSQPVLDHDMFAIMSGPTIAAIAVVFDHSEHEEVLLTCVDGFLGIAKISAFHHLEDVLDDLVVSLCKFTTLLNTSLVEEPVTAFGDDLKARLATETLFTIANRYGDYIRTGWRNVLDCILRLHKLGLLPARVASDAADDSEASMETVQGKPTPSSISTSHIPVMGTPRKSSGLMGRFSQLLSLDSEEPRSQPTEQQLAAHQRTLQTIQKCRIDSIFTESKFLQPDSLLQLARALIWAAGRPQKVASSPDDEDTAVFCLELLIAITLNNRDRIVLLWQGVYEHIANIVQSTVMPCALVEKAIFGLLRICQRLLPYKENLADELLRSLQLVLKLDARVADAYCENITQEVARLVKANAGHIKSQMGWRTVVLLLSITARHPDASGVGFEAIMFIMSEGHLSKSNYPFCIEASRQFAESRVGLTERSIRALDLMADSVSNLARWSQDTQGPGEEADKGFEIIREMWLKLLQALKKLSLDQREEVRNHALVSLQRCLTATEGICLQSSTWSHAFDLVIFALLDDLLEIGQNHSQKDYRNMEGSLVLAMKLVAKVYLQLLPDLFGLSSFCKLWLGVLSRMEKYIKIKVRGKRSDKLQELIPELLRSILVAMKSRGILAKRSTIGGDSLWELTWLHVNNISMGLQSEVFPSQEYEQPNNVSSPRGVNNVEAQN
ncbi:ARF guanine-nucleotide exchange factor GNOM-like [Lolium perenne]|uniref:ARF guanine-nucleotide exchange factor GNOM-like n=1 Tax=Lolium perenne TaxID=4522 RepID=UPI003A99DA7C